MICNLNEFSEFKQITTVDGCQMFVNPYDHYICRDLANNGKWEPHIRTVLNNICKPGMNFIDIGANVGAHTLYMSKLVGNTGKGFAFEPLSSHASILCFNLMNNQCFNTTVYQYGCSNVETTMYIEERFTNTKRSTNFGAITLQPDKKENDTTIQTVILDNLSLPNIDVVKIDAEQVILGMTQCIEKCKPIFIVEIHSENEKKMFKLFDSLNYNVRQIEYFYDYIASPK